MKLIIRNKNEQRLRRAAKTRSKIADSGNHRISIHRSIQHMYLQLITPNGDKVITLYQPIRKTIKPKLTILRVQQKLALEWLIILKKLRLQKSLLTVQVSIPWQSKSSC